MIWLLIGHLLFSAAMPKEMQRSRNAANRRVKAERRWEVGLPRRLPPVQAAPPGATTSVQIPITGSAVDSAGRKLTFSGVVTLSIDDTVIPPPPPVPAITGIRPAGQTALVGEAVSGAPLELVGTNLPVSATASSNLRLAIAGQAATVRQWSSTIVWFTAPTVTTTVSGPTQIWVQLNNAWTLAALGPSFSLRPQAAPVPLSGLPFATIFSFLGADGLQRNSFLPGSAVTFVGTQFGDQQGRVWIENREVPVKSWTSTRIDTTTGDTPTRGAAIELRLPDGRFRQSQYAVRIGR